MANPFRCFNSSPEVIRLVVMMYVKYPLSLRNVEDLLFERGIDICHETVRFWWNRFGPMFAGEIRRRRGSHVRGFTQWRWHLDEVYVKINGQMHYLWRAVDHEGEVLEALATKERDKPAALKLMKRLMKRYGRPVKVVTDGLRSYSAALGDLGMADRQVVGRWKNNRAENSHQPFRRAGESHAALPEDEPSRSSARSTAQSTTILVRSATSSAETSTGRDAPPPWRSGGQSWAKARSGLGFLRPPETSCR
jgi:putative transposase